jgi:hypothetical protein
VNVIFPLDYPLQTRFGEGSSRRSMILWLNLKL